MRALIADDVHEALFTYLEKVNIVIDYKPSIDKNQIEDCIGDYDILILRSKIQVTRALLLKARRLKIIGRCGAGMDNIDLEATEEMGITTFSANEGNRDSVAEHVMGLILGLLHRIAISNIEIQNFQWNREKNRGMELNTKTVGLVGYGHMGTAVAKRLSSFGCEVFAFDKYKKNYSDEYVKEVDMEYLFQNVDILSLHIPLTSETKFLVNDLFLERFKKPIMLINSSRGGVVDLNMAWNKLKAGKIFAMGLDVLENENLSTYNEKEIALLKNLNSADNVILTPHVAGWSKESYKKLSEILGGKIQKWIIKK